MDHVIDILDDWDRPFLGLFHVTQQARSAGEEDQDVCTPKAGDTGGELVVVAVAQFLDGDGVVLVDDGNDLGELDQAIEHRTHARGTLLILEIFMCDEKLGHMQAVIAQQRLISMHEMRLAHGSDRLKRGDVGGPLFELQRLQTRGHGTAADDNNRVPCPFEQGDGLDELAQLHGIRLWRVGAREDAGAEFENDALGCRCHGLRNEGRRIWRFAPRCKAQKPEATQTRLGKAGLLTTARRNWPR
jgi:hypothetical protein